MRPVLNLAGFTYSYLHYTHVAYSRPLEGRGTICLACRGLTRNPLRVSILFRSPKIVFKRRQKARFPSVAPIIGRSLLFAFVLFFFLLHFFTYLFGITFIIKLVHFSRLFEPNAIRIRHQIYVLYTIYLYGSLKSLKKKRKKA